MKIKMITDIGNKIIGEEYDIENNIEPKEYAENLIRNFNNTLRPGEHPRELVGVQVLDNNTNVIHKHEWEKQNAYTLKNRVGYYDSMKCRRCGITGKRYGIGGQVIRDTKFKAKIYDTCEGTLKQLNKISEKNKNDKHLKSLKRKASKLIAKCEDQDYEFTELECAAITNIGEAEKYGDINYLAENRFIELCEEWKIK